MNRRLFLGAGLAGTASLLLGWKGIANAMHYALPESFVFPAPVYRTLGRTGLKIAIVGFGAMLTPEPRALHLRLSSDRDAFRPATPREGAGGAR